MSAPRRCRRSTTTANTIAHAGAHTDAPSAAAAEAAAAARLWRALLLAWWCRLRKPLGPRRVARASRPAAVYDRRRPCSIAPLPPAAVRTPPPRCRWTPAVAQLLIRRRRPKQLGPSPARVYTSRLLTLTRTLAISGRRSLPPTLSLSLSRALSLPLTTHYHSLSRTPSAAAAVHPSSLSRLRRSRRHRTMFYTARGCRVIAPLVPYRYRYVQPCLQFETA